VRDNRLNILEQGKKFKYYDPFELDDEAEADTHCFLKVIATLLIFKVFINLF
jgi:hypothetical protein